MATCGHARRRISKISALHYTKLIFRSCLFIAAAALYIGMRLSIAKDIAELIEARRTALGVVLGVIWLVFATEMVLRFFPSGAESMGCEKQFARNYLPADPALAAAAPPAVTGRSVLAVAAAWIALNAAIGALYLTGVIDEGILLLVCLAFSVCDMICILYFCPFQTWFMKNKCCGSCRIYNWDYAMMFTPLIFVKSAYTWSLLGLAAALLLKWEIVAARHPERFSEATNASLSCANCRERLCRHKRSLRRFLLHRRERFLPRG